MTWPNERSIFSGAVAVILMLTALELSGCGVKGDPLPPVPPIEMGRGRPTYRRATKQIQIEKDAVDDEQKN